MHLPPHGVVQFIPLRDVDLSMGPTQFVPGTQIHCTPEWEKEETLPSALDTFMSTFCPEASLRIIDTDATAGTSLLFDFRTLHRGGKNAHPSARRPLMYMTFFQVRYQNQYLCDSTALTFLFLLFYRNGITTK
jgi:ectoine hydroxylase-related dioxygenase (phytanoyl-CoA dioxygenase family)